MNRTPTFGILAFVVAIPTRGDVLFQQQPKRSETMGVISTLNNQQMADDFRPSSAVEITGVNWLGFYVGDPAQPHQFRITFHSDANRAIVNQPFAQFTVSPSTLFAFRPAPDVAAVSSFAAVIPSVVIDANKRTWVSIVDINPSDGAQFRWQESSIATLSDDWGSRAVGDAWLISNGGNLSFSLTGTVVPEPTTNLLFGVGAAALLVCSRRQIRRQGVKKLSAFYVSDEVGEGLVS
ncbi:MAG TPA: PEP-CTERM sorting domain-containing protein [Verrucomicrobiae bacterium]|nr:PEP-CTERM sorting domain-containing protein [Verrucomicrobiae bacterium]